MTIGAARIPFATVIESLRIAGEGREQIIVWSVRLPRVIAAMSVGAALAVAGAIMQAVTRNPLADPGILGVNSGAAFAVVLLLATQGSVGTSLMIWTAFGGAFGAAVVVYALGTAGRSGATPLKLVLAGVVISTLLGSVTMAVLLLDQQTLENVRLWTAGSLRGRDLNQVLSMLPYLLVGLAFALAFRSQFTSMSLGSDTAQGLGQNQARWRFLAALLVVVLAGSAVAIAGPLGFVGLVVPHIVRMGISSDYRWILPFCALGGAFLTLLADVVPRALFSHDIPVGVTMALIGAPFFIWLARRDKGRAA